MSDQIRQDMAALADLVAGIGEADFLPRLVSAVARKLPHESAILMLYRPGAAPEHLAPETVPDAYREGVRNFLESTYVLNPFYRAFRGGLTGGLYFMRDVMPRSEDWPPEGGDGYRLRADGLEDIGYLTHGWPPGRQELMLAFELPEGAMLDISLSRPKEEGGIDGLDLEPLRAAFPVLQAAVVKHWQMSGQALAPAPRAAHLDQLFDDFGRETLSEREREIIRMILLGHSSASIALNLEIALPTVKTHRRNAYAKLEIATQAELFALFMKTVQSG